MEINFSFSLINNHLEFVQKVSGHALRMIFVIPAYLEASVQFFKVNVVELPST